MRRNMLIYDAPVLILVLLCILLFGAGWLNQQTLKLEQEHARLQQEIEFLEAENAQLRERIAELKEQQTELGDRMQDWLDAWEVDIWESTAYAPLDPEAIPGMCYSGDPRVTASGAELIPYKTAAAGPDVEFNTKIYVFGDGPRVVQDRGGRIQNGKIDLAMKTREEALIWGRKKVKVVCQK